MSRKKKTHPYWRPDFKIESTLPDIKVVRTNFIVNFTAIALVMVALSMLMQREYRAYTLRTAIDGMEQELLLSGPDDQKYLKESERFRVAGQSVLELQHFFQMPFTAHEFLVELARQRKEGIVFSSITFSQSVVTTSVKGKGDAKAKSKSQMAYKANIKGDVQELAVLTEFKRILQMSTLINPAGYEVSVDESMSQRDAATGIIPFQILISLTAGKAAGESKGAAK